MPANVSLEYLGAEAKYHLAKTTKEKIAALEEMIRYAPKHKGGENLQRELKKRLARLREETRAKVAASKPSFVLKKEGAARVCLVGLPNSGKSSLLNCLTNAHAQVANFPYTTISPEIGMLEYNEIKIQIVEIPATLTTEHSGTIRDSDLILFVIDTTQGFEEQKKMLLEKMHEFNIKVNETKPNVKIEKRASGGIIIQNRSLLRMREYSLKQILISRYYHNAVVSIGEPLTEERLEEALDESLAYIKVVFVCSKKDAGSKCENCIMVSAQKREGVEELKQTIYENLNIIRVFTKSHGEIQHPPMVMKTGSSVEDAARKIHKDFVKNFKYAVIWGKSAKFPGEKVGLAHVLKDGDVIEVHIK